MRTAYPVSYDETGIYTASNHAMQRFGIEQSGTIKLAEVIYGQFDENGNAVAVKYPCKHGCLARCTRE